MTHRDIILASGSPRRREIFAKLQIPFEVEESGYEENLQLRMPPARLAARIAMEKARRVAKRRPGAIVIGADTIVVYGKKIFGKARTAAEAERMLWKLRGRSHRVVTGIAIIDAVRCTEASKAVSTTVWFRKMTRKEIAAYVKTGEWRGKAGAYAAQGLGGRLIERISGDFYNVVGLPLSSLISEMEKIGIQAR